MPLKRYHIKFSFFSFRWNIRFFNEILMEKNNKRKGKIFVSPFVKSIFLTRAVGHKFLLKKVR